MTQQQIKDLFGVPPSTLKDWKNDPSNKKHNLGILLSSLDYEKTKKEVEKLSKKLDIVADSRL